MGSSHEMVLRAVRPDGTPVVGAHVWILQGEGEQILTTDARGHARFDGLAIGTSIRVRVTDADGTAETLWISPKIVRTGFSLTVEPVGEFVAGRPCVLSVKAVDRAAGTPAMGALRLDPGGEVVVDGRGRATVTVVPGEETEKLVVKAFLTGSPPGRSSSRSWSGRRGA